MNTENIVYKIVESKDIDLLCAFEENARKTEPDIWCDSFDSNDYKSKLLETDIDNVENSKIIAAYKDGEIIGRCDIQVSLSLWDFDKSAYIDWIYVLKSYRGQSIGKELFRFSEDYFKSIGVSRYFLFTASNDQAQAFYKGQKDFKFSKREVCEKDLT